MQQRVRVNYRVRAKEIRVIDEDGAQLGVMGPPEARQLAQDKGLDLVEVAPTARPPVCRIMDYGKYLYQQGKKAQEARKHQKTIQVKEVKFRPKIDRHDYEFKRNHIIRFLKDEARVKATVIFRGREITHSELGREILKRLEGELSEIADVEGHPRLEGHTMTMILTPKRQPGATGS